jgi:protease-4
MIMKDLYMTHDLFVKTVSENRKLDINKVKELANGWSYTGEEALELGLIDELGGVDDVVAYLEKNVLNNEKASVCW